MLKIYNNFNNTIYAINLIYKKFKDDELIIIKKIIDENIFTVDLSLSYNEIIDNYLKHKLRYIESEYDKYFILYKIYDTVNKEELINFFTKNIGDIEIIYNKIIDTYIEDKISIFAAFETKFNYIKDNFKKVDQFLKHRLIKVIYLLVNPTNPQDNIDKYIFFDKDKAKAEIYNTYSDIDAEILSEDLYYSDNYGIYYYIEKYILNVAIPNINTIMPNVPYMGIENEVNTCFFNSTINLLRSMTKLFLYNEININLITKIILYNFKDVSIEDQQNVIKFINFINPNLTNFKTNNINRIGSNCNYSGIYKLLNLRWKMQEDSGETFGTFINFIKELNTSYKKLFLNIHYLDFTQKSDIYYNENSNCMRLYDIESSLKPSKYEDMNKLDLAIIDINNLSENINSFTDFEKFDNYEQKIDKNYIYKKNGEKYIKSTNTIINTRISDSKINYNVCKKIELVNIALYLVIYLKIFNNDRTKKIINNNMVKEQITINNIKYKLASICLHGGETINSGHWVNLSLRNDGKYYEYNDTHVSKENSLENYLSNTSRTPALLLYVKIE